MGVATRVKTLAAQASDGSFHGVRENDILTAALETPEHRGRVRGVSSSLGWGKGFGEEFAGMYKKKRNKKAGPQMEDLVVEAVTRIISILAESGFDIRKNVLHPPQSPPVSSSEEEDVHDLEEEDVHGSEEEEARGREEDHWHVSEDEGSQQHIDSRSPMLDTIDKLTEPTKCSLLDGSGNKVELALATVFPLQKTLHTVPVQDGYCGAT